MADKILLNGSDWQFKEFHGSDWVWRNSIAPDTRDFRWWRSGTVPGSVQQDLWQNSEITNPYYEKNSLLCEWVSQRTWVYKKGFRAAPELAGKRIQLVFLGVDYSAKFFLNGEYLGSHDGMFTPVRFDVSGRIKPGEDNLVAVVIAPAPQEEPQVGYTSRVHTHKSRMGYWWDFCPRMVHLGIWQDVYLEVSGEVRISDVFVQPVLNAALDQAQINIAIDLDVQIESLVEMNLVIQHDETDVITVNEHRIVSARSAHQAFTVCVNNPQLWWPNGSGPQNLYEISVSVLVKGEISHQKSVCFGIRSVQMIANEGAAADALPYTFVINGCKTYIKGWNWVPIDVLYGVTRPEKLEWLLTLAQRAHVNMLRVWGGGLIEKEAFYEQCDRLGILIWQEFIQSSSGIENTPSDFSGFIQLMTHEAEQIVPLKRNHPALVVWCGGNELQAGDETPLDDSHPLLAALKEVVQRLDPQRVWLATSPTGRVFSNSIKNIQQDPSALHDVHGPWEYQGAVGQYELYNQGSALFHSEFGVEGITNKKTLDRVISPQKQWPVSLDENPYWWHLGAWWVQRATWDKVFGYLEDIQSYIRATQFTQFDGLRYALEADRRRKFHNSGTLPWQFNESYPMAACTSSVDYYGQPKPAYYAVAQAYEPLHISARFDRLTWQGLDTFECAVWVSNSKLFDFQNAQLTVAVVDLKGRVFGRRMTSVAFGANKSCHLMDFELDLHQVDEVFFLDINLQNSEGDHLSSNRYAFTRTDTLGALLIKTAAEISAFLEIQPGEWNILLRNEGKITAMHLWLEDAREPEGDGFVWISPNYFCLFPGEERRVRAVWQNDQEAKQRLDICGWNTNKIVLCG